ncbi:type II inositol 1,4,5-trisphosphate 5-phosphatase [Planococcus citri]|uniref:type II inositol 1,4,5-trisphosphate 5-phosphatase n=1 Tax=Planococcus citri TaxID=170843 RepID=UPI0031FA0966
MIFMNFKNKILQSLSGMDCSDALAKVQAKFTNGESVFAVYDAVLIEGWVKTSRILAVVEYCTSYGFFVFNVIRQGNFISEVIIDYAFPVDTEFKIAGDIEENCVDISMTVTSRKNKLLFEMMSGDKTKHFISELHRIAESASSEDLSFHWMRKYMSDARNCLDSENILSNHDMNGLIEENPVGADLFVPRDSIARGTTPLARRESAVRFQMVLKENDYTYTQTIKIFVGTWNVNGQNSNRHLSDWLSIDPEPPDIYAIGFQELDLSKEAFLFNDSPREEEWLSAVYVNLHPKDKYHKIALVRLVGIMLIVFVKEQHVAYVREVATDTVGTGIMGKLGNKGGVAVRLDIHNTSICFVNAHLAAHVEEFERRNQDYRDICSKISFPKFLPPKTIKDHDQIYWFGDLNYRITEMDVLTVKNLIEKNDYDSILVYDQLRQNHRKGRVFEKYLEGKINFRPTYKYDTGSDDWDSSEKNRAPAWCDRILWKGDKIRQTAYRSHPSLKTSDHKPVSALFDADIRVIDVTKYRKIHEEVMKKLDKLENEFLPQVMVDTTEIIFDNIYFLESQSKDLIIANTGQVPVQFEFIKKLDDSSYCKDWLHIEPYTGFIMPGEKNDVKLEVYVDKRSAYELNSSKDKLYDILVLHLEGGKDIFITVTGTYVYSCFGMSLDTLSRLRVPIRDLTREELIRLEKKLDADPEDPYQVPKEIWFLVDHLYRNAMKQQHLFEQPGLHSELLLIRDWLDTGVPEHLPGSVHSVAEALLLILDSTPEPIVPYSMHVDALNASTSYIQCKQIIMSLPILNRTVFLYLCAFLQELLSHCADNNLDAKTIATLFGSIFIRDMPQTKNRSQNMAKSKINQQQIDRKKANFVYHFLVNDQSDLIANRG